MSSVLVACGGASPQPSSTTATALADDAPDPRRAYALLPADSKGVLFLNIGGIRKARLYEVVRHDIAVWDARLREPVESGDDGESSRSPSSPETFLDLLDESSWMLVVDLPEVPPSPGAEDEESEGSPFDLYVVAGRLDGGLVKDLVRSEAEELIDGRIPMPGLGTGRTEQATPTVEVLVRTVREHQVFDTGTRAAAEVDEDVWVFGPTARVEALLARDDGASPREVPRTSAIDREIALFEHHVAVSALGDAAAPLLDAEDAHSFEAEAVSVVVDLDDGVTLQMIADAASSQEAQVMRDDVQAGIDSLLAESWAALFGIDRILGAVGAELDGTRVSVDVAISEGDARDLWGRAAGAIGAAFLVLDWFRGFGASPAGPSDSASGVDESQDSAVDPLL